MVIDFQTPTLRDTVTIEEEAPPRPSISVIEEEDDYGRFHVEPLEPGHGVTLGNPMRRILYSSLNGTAVTSVKIEGVLHEYTTIPKVKEEVSEFLLNVKGVKLRSETHRAGKLRLEVAGEGEVSAGDIMASADFVVVNPELHLATLGAPEARLSVEFNVEHGTGFKVAALGDGLPIGVLPVDAIFTPVRKVNYTVERTRVGQRTDYERLVLGVWTDGSITPSEAVKEAAKVLVAHFFLLESVKPPSEDNGEAPSPPISAEKANIPIEQLDLSSRTLNCLKKAGIDKVGQVLALKKADLLQIRNFGEKSLTELFDRLREMDLLPEEPVPEGGEQDGAAEGEVAEPAAEPVASNE